MTTAVVASLIKVLKWHAERDTLGVELAEVSSHSARGLSQQERVVVYDMCLSPRIRFRARSGVERLGRPAGVGDGVGR